MKKVKHKHRKKGTKQNETTSGLQKSNYYQKAQRNPKGEGSNRHLLIQ